MGHRPHRRGVSRVRLCKTSGTRLGCGGSRRIRALLGSSGANKTPDPGGGWDAIYPEGDRILISQDGRAFAAATQRFLRPD